MMVRPREVEHRYGEQVHILHDTTALTLLARLSQKMTRQPEIKRLLTLLYQRLIWEVISRELPTQQSVVDTRMKDLVPQGTWIGETVDFRTSIVVAAIARAGLVPAEICFDLFNEIFLPRNEGHFEGMVRQDHLPMQRTTHPETHEITGAVINGAKVGQDVQGAHIFVPDPMGATGSTLDTVLRFYREEVRGTPRGVFALHLIVTPEYLKRVLSSWPEVRIYALRLDRGLSTPEVLKTVPGERWDEERGLTDVGYVVPGAGGLGEVINNVWV